MDVLVWLHHLFAFYASVTVSISHSILSFIQNIKQFSHLFCLPEAILSLYFRLCGLSPCTIDLDDQTTMHFWTTNHRRFDRPNLVMIHGYGGNSRWQFVLQVGPLSRRFNLYIPDLLFFGESHTRRKERTVEFQASCACEGLKRLGVEKFSIYAISYGGYVGYRMAEMYGDMVDKVVIVSSGVGATEEQKENLLKKIGLSATDLLLPEKPEHLRFLIKLSIYKYNPLKWVPNFVLQNYLSVMGKKYHKEKRELVEHLLAKKLVVMDHISDHLPILNQETLLVWGDKDNIFPPFLGYQLQRHLGPKSKLEIIKDSGHAVNIDSPDSLNELITSFVFRGDPIDGSLKLIHY